MKFLHIAYLNCNGSENDNEVLRYSLTDLRTIIQVAVEGC